MKKTMRRVAASASALVAVLLAGGASRVASSRDAVEVLPSPPSRVDTRCEFAPQLQVAVARACARAVARVCRASTASLLAPLTVDGDARRRCRFLGSLAAIATNFDVDVRAECGHERQRDGSHRVARRVPRHTIIIWALPVVGASARSTACSSRHASARRCAFNCERRDARARSRLRCRIGALSTGSASQLRSDRLLSRYGRGSSTSCSNSCSFTCRSPSVDGRVATERRSARLIGVQRPERSRLRFLGWGSGGCTWSSAPWSCRCSSCRS